MRARSGTHLHMHGCPPLLSLQRIGTQVAICVPILWICLGIVACLFGRCQSPPSTTFLKQYFIDIFWRILLLGRCRHCWSKREMATTLAAGTYITVNCSDPWSAALCVDEGLCLFPGHHASSHPMDFNSSQHDCPYHYPRDSKKRGFDRGREISQKRMKGLSGIQRLQEQDWMGLLLVTSLRDFLKTSAFSCF